MSKKVIKLYHKNGKPLEYFIVDKYDYETNNYIGKWIPGNNICLIDKTTCRMDFDHYNYSGPYTLEFASLEETLKILLLYD